MRFFSEEAQLFSKEYDVVEAMRTAWAADIQRFFDALHPEVERRVGQTLSTRHSSGYRYWWLRSESPSMGNATLWSPREYPELIRDKSLIWEAYLDVRGTHAPEEVQAKWLRLVKPELPGVPGVFEIHQGTADSFRPLRLTFRWTQDPIIELAEPVARVLQVLSRAVSNLERTD
jgi:hypothetical protein